MAKTLGPKTPAAAAAVDHQPSASIASHRIIHSRSFLVYHIYIPNIALHQSFLQHTTIIMSSLKLTRSFFRSTFSPISRRTITTSSPLQSSWSSGPAPPRLPKEEQELFDKLMKQSTGAFSTPKESPTDTPAEASSSNPQVNQSPALNADGKGEELHPNIRRGAPPEFQGDINPETGEVGGPKNNPLRWGHASDWSYNGRVTDF
jgi:hypothetical protein